MAIIIVNRGFAAIADRGPWFGQFLEAYDPDGPDTPETTGMIGGGMLRWTYSIFAAMRFDDTAAAMTLWSKQSANRPTRPDGKPNKPLTAFTCEFVRTPELLRDGNPDDPVCCGCGQRPADIDEYVEIAREEKYDQPADYVIKEEGTYNRHNGHFMCTTCYIRIGQPSSRSGWKAP